MKVLIDESLPQKLRYYLSNHEVVTVRHLGWLSTKNGELIKRAEENGIEVLVTGDQNLQYQQNMAGRQIAFVMLSSNHWLIVKQHLNQIAAAVDSALPGSFREIPCGPFR